MTLSVSQISAIQATSSVMSAFSVVGSSFIVASYIAFPKLRKYSFTLVMVLSVNDLLNQIGDFLLPNPQHMAEMDAGLRPTSDLCYAQAWLESFFELSSILWTTAIAATLYLHVKLRWSSEEVIGTFWWAVAVCSGLPALLTLIPGLLGLYGPAGAWCWIIAGHGWWRFFQFFVPLLAAIIFNAYVYVEVLSILRNMMLAADQSGVGADPAVVKMREAVQRLRWYPLILVGVWLFAMINRLTETINGGKSVFVLLLLQKLTSSSQGFCNALAYGLVGEVRQSVQASLSKYCSCIPPPTSPSKAMMVTANPGRDAVARKGSRLDLEGEWSDAEGGRGEDDDLPLEAEPDHGIGAAGVAVDLDRAESGRSTGAAVMAQPLGSPDPPSHMELTPVHRESRAQRVARASTSSAEGE